MIRLRGSRPPVQRHRQWAKKNTFKMVNTHVAVDVRLAGAALAKQLLGGGPWPRACRNCGSQGRKGGAARPSRSELHTLNTALLSCCTPGKLEAPAAGKQPEVPGQRERTVGA